MALEIARRWPGVSVAGGPTFHVRRHSGVRGGPDHEVTTSEVWRNHHDYDTIIFRELYRELPLDAYLPDGHGLAASERTALLERLSVLTIHRVYPEVLQELAVLAETPTQGAYSPEERAILERMVGLTNGLATGDKRFAQAMSEWGGSQPIRQLRTALLTILARRVVNAWRSPGAAARLAWRSSWLLPGGARLATRRERGRDGRK